MNTTQDRIWREVDTLKQTLFAVSDFLRENPETAYQEYKACEHLCIVMREHGFDVERGVGAVETAFLDRPANRQPARPWRTDEDFKQLE